MIENPDSVGAALRCLDDFMTAFNARDLAAFAKTFNFPSVRFASNRMQLIEGPEAFKPEGFYSGALKDWHHSGWDRRVAIHAGPDKVHFDTRFTRYRADGSVIGHFNSIYVVTCEDGHWGVKARSSFAP